MKSLASRKRPCIDASASRGRDLFLRGFLRPLPDMSRPRYFVYTKNQHIMETFKTETKSYESPSTTVIELEQSGVICVSEIPTYTGFGEEELM